MIKREDWPVLRAEVAKSPHHGDAEAVTIVNSFGVSTARYCACWPSPLSGRKQAAAVLRQDPHLVASPQDVHGIVGPVAYVRSTRHVMVLTWHHSVMVLMMPAMTP